jgi:hypothetical protein
MIAQVSWENIAKTISGSCWVVGRNCSAELVPERLDFACKSYKAMGRCASALATA